MGARSPRGAEGAKASNPWQCQDRVAKTRPAPVIPGSARKTRQRASNPWRCQSWMAQRPQTPEIPGSANLEWRGGRKRQKSLAVPTLSGTKPPDAARRHNHPSLLCAQSYAYTHQRSASGAPRAGTAAVRSKYRSVS